MWTICHIVEFLHFVTASEMLTTFELSFVYPYTIEILSSSPGLQVLRLAQRLVKQPKYLTQMPLVLPHYQSTNVQVLGVI